MSNAEELVAPCGMNCLICSRYRSHVHQLKKSRCGGCREENKRCAYLFGKCEQKAIFENGTRNAPFCFDCEQFPCKEILRMDKRYRKNYRMSVIENLGEIQRCGVAKFLEKQTEKYSCPKCGGVISVHNRKCFQCDEITKLIEK